MLEWPRYLLLSANPGNHGRPKKPITRESPEPEPKPAGAGPLPEFFKPVAAVSSRPFQFDGGLKLQAVFIDLGQQGGTGDAQEFGGLATVAAGEVQGLANQ